MSARAYDHAGSYGGGAQGFRTMHKPMRMVRPSKLAVSFPRQFANETSSHLDPWNLAREISALSKMVWRSALPLKLAALRFADDISTEVQSASSSRTFCIWAPTKVAPFCCLSGQPL